MTITVSRLSITPVKGTRIHEVEAVELGAAGARGDRAFYVVDDAGEMINGKRLGGLQTVVADYDPAGETLALRFADGEQVSGPVRLGAPLPTRFFSRPRTARPLEGPWSEALSQRLRKPLRIVAAGSAVDRGAKGAVTIISRGSLERLAAAFADGTPVDARRFRMLIEVDGVDPHGEDRWVGRELRVGGARLRMHGHVGRCVTTTRDPESGEVNLPTLKMLATYRLDEPTTEAAAFGIHGAVRQGGRVALGDPVTVVGG